nr:RnfABCDGE type electron transport complex subunit A [Lachnospiraceae bacterium]
MSKKIKLFAMALLSLTVILQSFAGSKVVKAEGLKPGTYTAVGDGFGGDVTVTITVDENGITDALVEGPDETPAYGGAALEELTEQIKASTTGEIDGVSGATFTSGAAKEAFAAAFAEAKGEEAPAVVEEEETAEETVEEEAPEEKKVTFKSLIIIFISAILINNVVLSQFLGICPFLGVSKKVETAAGMGAAVIFVITIASMCTFGIQKLVLDKLGLQYMQTIVFILVIAALVQFVEMVLKKLVPSLYKALGVYLPLITTNCAVLGVSINNITYGHTFLESIFYSVGISTGFALAIVIMAGIRERNEDNDVPNAFKGSP